MKRLCRIVPLGGGLLMLPVTAMAQGMPQLNFNTPLTISQVVWGAIIFGVLYVMLTSKGLPLVESVLTERAAHISRDLDGARVAKTNADADMQEAASATDKARAEAQLAINAAVEEARKTAAAQSEALNARLEARLHESETQIAQARTAAVGALRQVATDTATSLVTRLTGSPPDTSRLEHAVGVALAARGVD